MVNGIESNRYIQKGKGSDRPFGHIKKNIIKEGTFSRMVFSISLLEDSHKASFIKISFCSWTAATLSSIFEIKFKFETGL